MKLKIGQIITKEMLSVGLKGVIGNRAPFIVLFQHSKYYDWVCINRAWDTLPGGLIVLAEYEVINGKN